MWLEYHFKIVPLQPANEILIAELDLAGFESFVETSDGIKAYIQKDNWRKDILDTVQVLKNTDFNITCTCKEIPQRNWNTEWEKNFNPVTVDGICTVRAPFHSKPNTRFDILISPKMSFGTGHHETTEMMLRFLLKSNIKDKHVLDMGCGTGVLSILAAQKGAIHVDAIDVDPWCYQNTRENTAQNHCKNIAVYEGDVSLIKGKKYDIILANINKNVLLADIPVYAACLNNNGILLLSGFYREDMAVIQNKCLKLSLKYIENIEKNEWVAVKLCKLA
ncbi:MAG: 50S ribosomal protein L11 methyltransferase [Bacteroidota bacterium]